jgi:hypothetical protein
MTRTNVSEGELVDLGRKSLALMSGLCGLAGQLENISEHGRGSLSTASIRADDLAELAREVSDSVDSLCEFVRTSRMIDGATV